MLTAAPQGRSLVSDQTSVTDMDEIVEEFLVESAENLDRLDIELVELEERPDSPELVASIFRNIHTIKGTSGFFEFANVEAVSHSAESLLSRLRDGDLAPTAAITTALLTTVDVLRSMMATIAETGNDGDDAHPSLVAILDALTSGDAAPQTEPASTDVAPPVDAGPEPEPEPAESLAEPAHVAAATDSSIRVDVGLLDRLMNLVGELVLARNQVLQHQTHSPDSSFQSTSQQLDLITTELQESVMKTRMQPIGSVWAKLPRVVRDLAAQCDKKVRLVMEGEETELDKTLIEAIKDPLTHIVRNSVDHGLESVADRLAAGKPETGVLRLRALHEGGQVIIEVSDDGAGLDHTRIREKAVASGIITAERAAQLGERETAALIFRPGFSTAAAVTNVSGRGVGMDVVKTNVEKIGGTLEVSSERGQGTTLVIKIPLTLAIIPALIVTCDADRYLIPQINLVEVLRVDGGGSTDSKIEMAGDAPVLRLRGNLLPIVHLRSVLELDAATAAGDDGVSIAVLDADGVQFGLVVDHINDTEEIVVKPLSPHLKELGCFAGTTIMGDGAVSLILDAIGLARRGGVLLERGDRDEIVVDDPDERRRNTQMVLVCTVAQQRIGIPLAHVSRLEELPSRSIERAAGHDVIQYRTDLLRLIHLRAALGEPPSPEAMPEMLQVLVHDSPAGVHGLVVDEIVDVYEIDIDTQTTSDGIRISGVVGRRVTDLLNIDRIIAADNARDAYAGALATAGSPS